MGKGEQIKHWKESALESWDSALYLAKGKHYGLSLFALHLTLEKLMKAVWIKEIIGGNPPYTHDLQKLCSEMQLSMSTDDFDFLAIVNSWNTRESYPDYTRELNQQFTGRYLEAQLEKVKKIKEWLEKKI